MTGIEKTMTLSNTGAERRHTRSGRRSPLATVALIMIGLLSTGGAYALYTTSATAETTAATDQVADGGKLFAANWTIEEGAGRPLTKGNGRALSDPTAPLVGARSFNRISGPDANSCTACHNTPLSHVGGGGDFANNVFVLGQRYDFATFDRNDTLQHDFLRKVNRQHLTPPATWIPSVGEFDNAVRRGMGWGMIPEAQVRADLDRGRLVELVPGRYSDVPLFWQHWRLESPLMADLTSEIIEAAKGWLR